MMRKPLNRWIGTAATVSLALAPSLTLPAAQPGDRPLKIIQTTEVRLNSTLDPEVPTHGEVRLLLLVDDHGQLNDLLLIGSTHSSFTQAAVAALQEWEFEPARLQGQPVWTRNTVRIFFDVRGRIVSVTGAEVLSNLVGRPFAPEFNSRLALESELDAPLQTSATVPPRFPVQLSGRLAERAAVVLDFYVDETGRPRMPVALRSAHPLLTAAAMEALDRWRFEPPTRDRQPVIVRAEQEFVFLESGQGGTIEPVATGPAS